MQKQVHLHQFTGMVDVDVPLRFGLRSVELGRRRVPGNQSQALASGVQPVPAQHAPDPVGRELEPAPQRPRQLGGDAGWPKPGMSQREGDDALLDEG